MSVRTIVVCEAQVPFVHGGAEIHVRELVRERRLLPDDQLDRILSPAAMTSPGVPGEDES